MLRRINPNAKIITDNPHYPQLPDNWVLTKLGDVVKVINGKSQKEVENPSGAYPIYGSGGVIGKADAYSCLSGSTIIGRKGTINNPQFIETNFWNVDTAFGMKPYEAVNDLYFYYFCKSFDFTSLDKSSTLPSLTKTAIEGILMPTPPLGEQRRIILKIKEYDELFRNIFTQIGQK
jgi:type I restriction enzyme S subunit